MCSTLEAHYTNYLGPRLLAAKELHLYNEGWIYKKERI